MTRNEAAAHLHLILVEGLAGEANDDDKAKDAEAVRLAVESLQYSTESDTGNLLWWVHDSECCAGQGCNVGCFAVPHKTKCNDRDEAQYWAFRVREIGYEAAMQRCVSALIEYKTAMMRYYNELESLRGEQ